MHPSQNELPQELQSVLAKGLWSLFKDQFGGWMLVNRCDPQKFDTAEFTENRLAVHYSELPYTEKNPTGIFEESGFMGYSHKTKICIFLPIHSNELHVKGEEKAVPLQALIDWMEKNNKAEYPVPVTK